MELQNIDRNFLFHPLGEHHTNDTMICSIITNIALTVLTGGLYLLVFAAVNLYDRYVQPIDRNSLSQNSTSKKTDDTAQVILDDNNNDPIEEVPITPPSSPRPKPVIENPPAPEPTPPQPPSPPENTMDISELFWETYLNDNESNLHRLFQMMMHSMQEENLKVENIATALIEQFESYQKQANPEFNLSQESNAHLLKEIVKIIQYEKDNFITAKPSTTHKAPIKIDYEQREVTIKVYQTVGDGSCGLHAMLGTQNENGYYQCDAAARRVEFCDWLQEKRNDNVLPDCITAILRDYFLFFNRSSPGFRSNAEIKQIHDELYKSYQEINTRISELSQLDNEADLEEKNVLIQKSEEIVNQFISDDRVFNAYLTNLKRVGTYLLQDELIAAAIYFDMKIYLYQPGWGYNHQPRCEILNPEGKNEVGIWYNGFNHYERADTPLEAE